MKLLICDLEKEEGVWNWEVDYLLSAIGEKYQSVITDKPLQDYNDGLNEVEVLSVFVRSRVGKDQLDKMPNLKYIVTRSTGFDHIDTNECKQRNIMVSSVPSYGENTVAEYAFALLLSLGRKMYEARDRVIRGNYSLKGLMGFDLQGKTMGVVGGGKIGMHVNRIAKGFGMKVVCFDPRPNQELADRIGFEYVSLDTLYANSDVISLHVPLIPQTKDMINKEALAKMKDGVILINTARGGIIDTSSLVEALVSGKVGGAGLDVMEEEDFLTKEWQASVGESDVEKLKNALLDHMLMDRSNVVATFHNAFNTREGRERILNVTLENLMGYAEGKILNQVI